MAQAGFAYDTSEGNAAEVNRLPLAVSIFADRPHLRDTIREDALAAGLRIGQCAGLEALLGSEAIPLGEVVLLDCPQVDAERLAALSRLDMRIARSAAHLVISTSVEALEGVFACVDQSQAQILVDPSRAERVVALGRVIGRAANLRLREMTEQDRLALLRIAEQVDEISQRLDRIGLGLDETGMPRDPEGALSGDRSRLESPGSGFYGAPGGDGQGEGARLRSTARPPLPSARFVRGIIRQRQLRARFFDAALFADPAWDILLDLTAARAEEKRVSVTSLCIASGVPPTTALRWIGQMTDAGLLQRIEDETDRRRAFIALTDKAADAMAYYFEELRRFVADAV